MLKKFGYDMMPVLAGVLLALFIDNWRDSIREERFVEKVLETIIQENQTNIGNINEVLVGQQMIRDTLGYYSEQEDVSVFDVVSQLNGLKTPDIVDNGIRYLFTYNQTILDIQTLLQIAEIQGEIENYHMAQEKLIEVLYQDLYNYDSKSKRRLQLMLNDMMNYERKLIILFEQFEESRI